MREPEQKRRLTNRVIAEITVITGRMIDAEQVWLLGSKLDGLWDAAYEAGARSRDEEGAPEERHCERLACTRIGRYPAGGLCPEHLREDRDHWNKRAISAEANASAMQKALAVLADAIANGEDLHTESCPEDDTCVCRLVSVINAALACPSCRIPRPSAPCPHCRHRAHTGPCNAQSGGTAYRCLCLHDSLHPPIDALCPKCSTPFTPKELGQIMCRKCAEKDMANAYPVDTQ